MVGWIIIGCKSPMKSKIFITVSTVIFIGLISFAFIRLSGGRKVQPDNIVIISIDTCRADRLSCYGYTPKTTPNIDEIAKKGILFENVISPVPTTLPAHSSMLTGTIPPYHGVHDNVGDILGDSSITLAEVLKQNGFATAAFVSTFVLDSKFGMKQGFDVYDDDFSQARNAIGMLERIGEETNAQALDWLDKHQKEEFFLFLHYYDPHHPYQPPEQFESKMRTAFKDAKLDLNEEQKEHLDMVIRYAAEISYVDYCIGQVIEKLKSLDLYDSALVIITADHGESLYEHKEKTHAYYTYQSTIAVPLIFKLPGGPQGLRIKDNAGLVDIVPTVCSLLDITPPPVLHGKDLSPQFSAKNAPSPERTFYAESFLPTQYQCNPLLAVVNDRYKYIHTTVPEFYDLDHDPGELNNVIAQHPKRARMMKGQLSLILEDAYKNQIQSKKTADLDTIAQLESLGYVSGGHRPVSYEFDPSKNDAKSMIDYHLDVDEGIYLFTTKQYDSAAKLFRRLIAEQPQLSISYLKLAAVAKEKGNFKECISHYQKVIELRPDHISAYYELGQAYFSLGKLDPAIRIYQKGLAIDENNLAIICSLADAYYKQRNFDKAATYYQSALKLKPDFIDVRMLLAGAFLEIGQIESAIAQYRRVLDVDDNNHKAHYWLGRAFSLQGKLDQAAESYQKTLGIKKDSFAATHSLADIYYKQQNTDMAIAYYQRALDIKPDSLEVMEKLAEVFLKTDQIQSAIIQYRSILELDNNHLKALNDIAWIQATSDDPNIRDPQSALLLAKKACKIADYNIPEVLGTLAAGYAASEQFDQAVTTAQKALELAKTAGKTELTEKLQSSLNLYKNNLSH